MAGGVAKRGGDRVLESRHLVGLFLGMVLLCGVFFTLGYVMGRTQYGLPMPLHASAATKDDALASRVAEPAKGEAKDNGQPAANGEWDFYSSEKNPNRLETPAAATTNTPAAPHHAADARHDSAATKAVSANPKEVGKFPPPRIPRGAIILQLAALTKEADAMAVADALQQKHFPSFVVTPTTDHFYRVQVGPYADRQSAEQTRQMLKRAGFKSIIKR